MLNQFMVAIMAIAVSVAENGPYDTDSYQQARNSSLCNGRLSDVAVLLDASDSIAPSQFEIAKTRTAEIVQQLSANPENRQLVILFSDFTKELFSLDSTAAAEEKYQKILAAPYLDSSTNTGAAIDQTYPILRLATRQDPKGNKVPQTILVITGGSSSDHFVLSDAVPKAKHAGINIVAVGVGAGNQFYPIELNFIASKLENVFTAKDFESLKDQVGRIVQAMC